MQLAAAQKVEAELRTAHPNLPSPLGVRYDFWSGETDLARYVPSPVDAQVRSVVREYLQAPDERRSVLRISLTMDDLYTVLDFSRRSAVAALRDRSLDVARDALLALALIDIARIDWRDLPGPLELAAGAVAEVGGDLAAELQELRTASPEETGSMTERLELPGGEPTLASAGYAPVNTSHGFGLVECRFGRRKVSHLGPLLVAFADDVDDDDYRTSTLTLRDELPSVWFPKAVRQRAESLIRTATACGTLHARRKPGPDSDSQQFTLFLLDTGSSAVASELLTLARTDAESTHASLAVTDGSLFALLIARSFVQGTEGVETNDSLKRFAARFERVLGAS